MCYFHAQGRFNGSQMSIHGAAQGVQTGIAQWCKRMAQNQRDNPLQWALS
jgi:hypothetical protein